MMALQGTLDGFSLPDVLELLAACAKTGSLTLDGDHSRGEVRVANGAVITATADLSRPDTPREEVLFELLRNEQGSFHFDGDVVPVETDEPPIAVELLLRRAVALIDEWRDLEMIVPTMDHRVSLVAELPSDVTIDAARWLGVVALGSSKLVRELADTMCVGDIGVGRMVRDLVELGVAVVEAPTVASTSSRYRRRNGSGIGRAAQSAEQEMDSFPEPAPLLAETGA